jgi:predicted phosphodiesterase
MRYAILSDIHGNLHGLKAVLEDAKKNKADRYLLLGDYFLDFPYPNEAVDLVRSLSGATVIKGNKDHKLLKMKNEDRYRKQMAAANWNLCQLRPDNLAYLDALPETEEISENGVTIRLMHSWDIFYRQQRIQPFYSSWVHDQMKRTPFSHEEYLAAALGALMSRPDAVADMESLPKGIYLFGHNHLQFHTEYRGRTFINPGSCGIPLDGRTTAAYTLLDISGDGLRITERSIIYDTAEVINELKASSLNSEAPEWCRIVEKTLLDGLDYFAVFLRHVLETAHTLGDHRYPVTDDSWDIASSIWDFDTMTKRIGST